MTNITYKNCNIIIDGYDMGYKVTIDIGLKKCYVINYEFKSYEDVKKDVKRIIRNKFRLN